MNMAISALFAFVVLLLSIGAIGELVGSLFSKKEDSLAHSNETSDELLEAAPQYR